MEFRVVPQYSQPSYPPAEVFYLIEDKWDDWGKFSTLYRLVYIDDAGDKHVIGQVKIGEFKMKSKQRRANLQESFHKLTSKQFSLGQDSSYHENLQRIGGKLRDDVLIALNDLARNQTLFKRAMKEEVTKISLLREVSPTSVRGQFFRLANGERSLTTYNFTYRAPVTPDEAVPVHLEFHVQPGAAIPSNIHVLIGTNGVGKTSLLNNMIKSLVTKPKKENVGAFFFVDDEDDDDPTFAGVVSVSFSAFDIAEPLPEIKDKTSGIKYFYVGLKTRSKTKDTVVTKGSATLDNEFAKSILSCQLGGKVARWKKAIEMLERSLNFREAGISALIDIEQDDALKAAAKETFHYLSSGHKIIVLTIAKLIETVEEKTLVLIDEPEAHLHPPLLSALIRVLSDLLIDRNGVAIIATHSPVVLQEVPRQCVWILRRSGNITRAARPETETFGENVGELTREVFGLEVTATGFHTLLASAVEDFETYEDILNHFNDELGIEAKGIVRALLAIKNKGRNDLDR